MCMRRHKAVLGILGVFALSLILSFGHAEARGGGWVQGGLEAGSYYGDRLMTSDGVNSQQTSMQMEIYLNGTVKVKVGKMRFDGTAIGTSFSAFYDDGYSAYTITGTAVPSSGGLSIDAVMSGGMGLYLKVQGKLKRMR